MGMWSSLDVGTDLMGSGPTHSFGSGKPVNPLTSHSSRPNAQFRERQLVNPLTSHSSDPTHSVVSDNLSTLYQPRVARRSYEDEAHCAKCRGHGRTVSGSDVSPRGCGDLHREELWQLR